MTIKVEGFSTEHTGGGCMALMRDFGDSYVMITDGGGLELPTADDWMVGVYDPDQGEAVELYDPKDGSFDAVLAQAIERAEIITMEAAAKARGERI